MSIDLSDLCFLVLSSSIVIPLKGMKDGVLSLLFFNSNCKPEWENTFKYKQVKLLINLFSHRIIFAVYIFCLLAS